MSMKTGAVFLEQVNPQSFSVQERRQKCSCAKKIVALATRGELYAHRTADGARHIGCETCWKDPATITPVVVDFRVMAIQKKCLGCGEHVDITSIVPDLVKAKNRVLLQQKNSVLWQQRKIPIQIFQSVVRAPLTLIAGVGVSAFSWWLHGLPATEAEFRLMGGLRGATGVLTAQLITPERGKFHNTPQKELQASQKAHAVGLVSAVMGGGVEEVTKRCLRINPGIQVAGVLVRGGIGTLVGAATGTFVGLVSRSSAERIEDKLMQGAVVGTLCGIGTDLVLPAVQAIFEQYTSPIVATFAAPSTTLLAMYVVHEVAYFAIDPISRIFNRFFKKPACVPAP